MSEKIRGSVDIPLNDTGKKHAKDGAKWLKRNCKVKFVQPSSLDRTIETAFIVSDVTGAKVLEPSEKLDPWHLGKFEGQESNKVRSQLEEYVRNPDEKVPGKIKGATHDGESFGSFRRRTIPFIKQLIDKYGQDECSLVIVTHYRDIHLIRSWCACGCPSDLSIDTEMMLKKYGEPGEIYHLTGTSKKCKIVDIDTSQDQKLGPGIIVMRHGDTDWNG